MQVETGRLRVVVPEDPGAASIDVPSPGRFLREQRKRRGMSIEQLAAATKIPRRSLELLEEDRYDALPGPVFAKGFLRCAARALGVDVQTVMDLLYERERAALSARRRERPASAPATLADEPAARRSTEGTRRATERAVERRPTPAQIEIETATAEREPDEVLERGAEAPMERMPDAVPRRPGDVQRRRPPRLRARPAGGKRVLDRVRAQLPSPAVFLWVVVAAFVAMVVLAAFNMVGGAAPGGPS